MTKYIARISQRNQITVPVEVRRLLGVTHGNRLEFSIGDDRVVVRRAAFTVQEVYRSVEPLSQPMDFDAAIRDAKEERVERMRHEWESRDQ